MADLKLFFLWFVCIRWDFVLGLVVLLWLVGVLMGGIDWWGICWHGYEWQVWDL